MNAVGKKTKLSRDFRNNYAQKARFEDSNIWLEPSQDQHQGTRPTSANEESRDGSRSTKGRDQHQGTRPTSRNEESRDGSRSTKGRDQHQGTIKAETEARKKH